MPSLDPTASTTRREAFKRKFHARWRAVRGDVRSLLRSDRHFRPTGGRLSDAERVADFREWLEAKLNEEVLEKAPHRAVVQGRHWTSPVIRDLYQHGLRQADRALEQAGWEFSAPTPEASVRYPVFREDLEFQFVEVYQDIEDAVRAAERDATRAYREAVETDASVSETAAAVNDRLDKVGRYRTDLVAVTESVEIINDASLTRYEYVGAEEVGVDVETIPEDGDGDGDEDGDENGEVLSHCCTQAVVEALDEHDGDVRQVWQAVNDDRTCPECSVLSGNVYTIAEMRSRAAPKPPLHPNCRCHVTPLTPDDDWS